MRYCKLLVCVMALAVIFAGCRLRKQREELPQAETELPTQVEETTAEIAPTTDYTYEGGILEESEEISDDQNGTFETVPETEPENKATEPTQSSGGIADNYEGGDFLEPPAESSDGVL